MIQLGDFTIDEKQSQLLHQGDVVAIEPKLFDLLLLFISKPNAIITRQEILETLWPNSLITDNAINKQVANLRKVLGDSAKSPRYLETVPKRGYRLICAVETINIATSSVDKSPLTELNEEEQVKKSSNIGHLSIVIFTGLFLTLGYLISLQFSDSGKENKNTSIIELTRAHGIEESAQIHPNGRFLFYLKESPDKNGKQLWLSDINSGNTQLIETSTNNISELFAVAEAKNNKQIKLLYLARQGSMCSVYQAILDEQSTFGQEPLKTRQLTWQQTKKLFDCNDKRIKDLEYNPLQNVIYYTAQPKNFWPNHIYSYDISQDKHALVTQEMPKGWGHHDIAISPNGKKLLIMSTNKDQKTQLLSLNIETGTITKGKQFDYVLTGAIWAHDSSHVYYRANTPSHQIMFSDIFGKEPESVVSISEYMSKNLSLMPDGKNLLFSTEKKNYSNRLIEVTAENDVEVNSKHTSLDNSTVNDGTPALFKDSSRYLFTSKRTGKTQIYLADYTSSTSTLLTHFTENYVVNYLVLSASNDSLLLSTGDNVFAIAMTHLTGKKSLTELSDEHRIFTSKAPIIAVSWFANNIAAITQVVNGTPELVLIDTSTKKPLALEGNWAYGFVDRFNGQDSYLIEKESNLLVKIDSVLVSEHLTSDSKTTAMFDKNTLKLTQTNVKLPSEFFHAKIDSATLYYGHMEQGVEYIHAVAINSSNAPSKFKTSQLMGYDVRNGSIIVSDIESLEGDIHRTSR